MDFNIKLSVDNYHKTNVHLYRQILAAMLPTCEIANKTAFYKTGMNYECEVGSMISRGGDEKVSRHFYTNQRNLAGY